MFVLGRVIMFMLYSVSDRSNEPHIKYQYIEHFYRK